MKSDRRFSRPGGRHALAAAVCGISFTLSGCLTGVVITNTAASIPEDSNTFFAEELARVAPELTGKELFHLQSSHASNARGPSRSQFAVLFQYKEDLGEDTDRPIPYIRMVGNPVNGGREVEVTVYTGHMQFVPPHRYPNRPPLTLHNGQGPPLTLDGAPQNQFGVLKSLNEKLHCRKVHTVPGMTP